MKSLILEQRTLLGLSTTELAHRLGVSQSSAVRLEQSEAAGTITIASLKRAARAMGCELHYLLEPDSSTQRIKPYHGLQRSRGAELRRRESAVEQALTKDVEKQARAISPIERIQQTCSLSDLARELRKCSKKR